MRHILSCHSAWQRHMRDDLREWWNIETSDCPTRDVGRLLVQVCPSHDPLSEHVPSWKRLKGSTRGNMHGGNMNLRRVRLSRENLEAISHE